jgi:hypothetical protein
MNEVSESTMEWIVGRFGIDPADVVWYHSGICYNRIVVKTKAAADKVTQVARKRTANGGWFHGMTLGGQTARPDGTFDVMC